MTEPTLVPDVINSYFTASAGHDTDALVALFADDAVVVDEGRTYVGPDAIRGWRDDVSSQYEFTTDLVAASEEDLGRYLVTARIEGNFPGGVATLVFDFTVGEAGLIASLTIAP